jgi:L-ascorbate metabolism protein UlaG (beta-lactamase superfamily)
VRITWLGHSSVLLETGAARLLTDPLLRRRVAHLLRHGPAPPDPGPVDGVLLSHVHRDHLDRPSLRSLARPQTIAVVPRGAGRLLRRMAFGAVRQVRAGDVVTIAGASVRAVPAWHEARRRPGAATVDALGYLVDRVWFAGDTGVDPAMAELNGEVDVALVPVWGWGPTLGPGHMDPAEAARAIALVAPAIAVPIHWGTFLPAGLRGRHEDLLTEPPLRFAAEVASVAPATRVVTLAPGEALEPFG